MHLATPRSTSEYFCCASSALSSSTEGASPGAAGATAGAGRCAGAGAAVGAAAGAAGAAGAPDAPGAPGVPARGAAAHAGAVISDNASVDNRKRMIPPGVGVRALYDHGPVCGDVGLARVIGTCRRRTRYLSG